MDLWSYAVAHFGHFMTLAGAGTINRVQLLFKKLSGGDVKKKGSQGPWTVSVSFGKIDDTMTVDMY